MRASDESPACSVPVGALERSVRVRTLALGMIVMALVALACGTAKQRSAQVIAGRHETSTSGTGRGSATTRAGASPATTGAGAATTGSEPSSGGQGPATTNGGGFVPTTASRPTTMTTLKSAMKRRDVPPGAVPGNPADHDSPVRPRRRVEAHHQELEFGRDRHDDGGLLPEL